MVSQSRKAIPAVCTAESCTFKVWKVGLPAAIATNGHINHVQDCVKQISNLALFVNVVWSETFIYFFVVNLIFPFNLLHF